MADLHTGAIAPPKNTSLIHATSADPCTRKNAYSRPRSARRTKAIFSINAGIYVVHDDRRTAEHLF
jgi:hypothetical protein